MICWFGTRKEEDEFPECDRLDEDEIAAVECLRCFLSTLDLERE